MELFCTTKNIEAPCISGTDTIKQLAAPPTESISSGQIQGKHIYFTTESHVIQIKNDIVKLYNEDCIIMAPPETKNGILASGLLPPRVGNYWDETQEFNHIEKQLEPLWGNKTLKLAIINGFGTGIGDSLVGLRALELLYKKLLDGFDYIYISIFQINAIKNIELFGPVPYISQCIQLPCPLSDLSTFDAYVDFSSMIVRSKFNELPFIDFYLETLGIDPKTVSSDKKEPKIEIDQNTAQGFKNAFSMMKDRHPKRLLFHPLASTEIRSMPAIKAKEFIYELLEETEYTIISVIPIPINHERFLDLSCFSNSLKELACIISEMDAVLSVDTGIYHIANALSIPSVALFTTIEPELRVSYYRRCKGIRAWENPDNLDGKHHTLDTQEIEQSVEKWNYLTFGRVVEAFDQIGIEIKKPEINFIKTLSEMMNHLPTNNTNIWTIIPHYGDDKILNNCLSAIAQINEIDPKKIIIINNNQNNQYFTKAVNQGIQEALSSGAEYIWILNNDTVPKPNYLSATLDRFNQSPKAGIVGGKNLVQNDLDHICWGGSFEAFPCGSHKSGSNSNGELNSASIEPWATFSSVVIKREVFETIGLLDESMLFICSDSDFSFRSRAYGYEVWYEPKAEIIHAVGVSSTGENSLIQEIKQHDLFNFFAKWSCIVRNSSFEELDKNINNYIRLCLTINGTPPPAKLIYQKSNYQPYRSAETTKAHNRRINEQFFSQYCQGIGLDIGYGGDLVAPNAIGWDIEDGNAEDLTGCPMDCFDFVYSSHNLEHIDNPETALKNWGSSLKQGGYLLISVPHRDLYEKQKELPSRWNSDHKRFFLPYTDEGTSTIGLIPLIKESLPDFEYISLRVCDEGHTITTPDEHSDGEYSIEVILRKPIMNFSDQRPEISEEKRSEVNIPLVSIIIPTYNRKDFLPIAIQSAIDQTYRNIEIIVINDGGENVSNIIKKFSDRSVPIRYIHNKKNRGLSYSRNCGIKKATGTYLCYLDDDDSLYPSHVETLVDFLEKNRAEIAYTDAYRAHQTMKDGKYITTHKDTPYSIDFDTKKILAGNITPVLCVMHRKDCLEKIGLFDTTLKSHEDWDLWIRLSRRYDFHHIKQITCEFTWRTDQSSMTSDSENDFSETFLLIQKKIQLERNIQLSFFQQFDKIYLINLPQRQDRLRHAYEQANELGFEFSLVEAVDGENIDLPCNTREKRTIGCTLSHHSIYEDVLNNNYNKVLVLEDDYLFESQSLKKLEHFMESLPYDWDFINFGGNHKKYPKMVDQITIKLEGSRATHAYAMTYKGCQKIYRASHEALKSLLITGNFNTELTAIDVHHEQMQSRQMINAYGPATPLITQYPNYSDIEGIEVDYIPHYKKDISRK